VEFGGFGIFAAAGRQSSAARAFDVLMALIEASRAVCQQGRAFEPRLASGSSTRTGGRAQDCRAAKEGRLEHRCRTTHKASAPKQTAAIKWKKRHTRHGWGR
jgi:hypothetical protein